MGKCKECKYYKPTTSLCIFRKELTTENNFCGGFSRDCSVRGILATLSEDEFAACLEVVEKMRAEIEKYCEDNNIGWVLDSSNLSLEQSFLLVDK